MTRYAAFLRGINVGGHNVKSDQLKQIFGGMGLHDVSTFIASGNVVFTTDGGADEDRASLERRIEASLKDALGYEAATFLRTDQELAEIAELDAFPDISRKEGDGTFILFLRDAPPANVRKAVEALSNEHDVFRVHGSNLYWLRRGSLLDATVSDKALAQALGTRTEMTNRNMNTIRRMAAKYPASATKG
jgi:uncharacterized protein (DUF1697 family)